MVFTAAAIAALERRRQQGRARPAYRGYLGRAHTWLEVYAREQLAAARPGAWREFYAATAADAAALDQSVRYIVRQERPAESVRVEWLRADRSWRAGFPRPLDRQGHGETARLRREVREQLAAAEGRQAPAFDPAELARMARVLAPDGGGQCYAARLRLGPKRGTAAPPEQPRPRLSMPAVLRRALAGDD